MEIGQQIKRLRGEFKFSQEDLAEKIYVSRQTISNWENDKSYPDLKSLVLVSNLFQITLDELVKGDIEAMKEKVKIEDIKQFKQASNIFGVLMILVMVLPIPLSRILGQIGLWIWAIVFLFSIYYSIKVERLKKSFDVHTYKEIIAFLDGESLDNVMKNQEQGKRPYQKILLAIGAGLLTAVVAMVMAGCFR